MKNILKTLSALALAFLLALSVACSPKTNPENASNDGFTFTEIGETLAVSGYTGSKSKVVIPDKKDGKSVTRIMENAFDTNEIVVEVVIPQGVTEIDEFAFKDCKNLKTVNIPSSVNKIGESAFIGCNSLNYTEDDGLFYLGSSENPYYYLSHVAKTVEDVVVQDDCKIIGGGAFENCKSLTVLKLPKKLIRISDNAFTGADALRSLFYFGTEADWNKITLSSQWTSGSNLYAVVVYGGMIDLKK